MLLAVGVRGWTKLTKLGLAISAVASTLQLYWSLEASGNTEPIDQPIVQEYWYIWVAVFGALTVGLAVFIASMPSHCRRQWAAAQVVMYVLGIVFAMMMQTGDQIWHVPTAGSFLLAFAVQVLWIWKAGKRARVHAD